MFSLHTERTILNWTNADNITIWHQITVSITIVNKRAQVKERLINTLWKFHFLEEHFPAAQGIAENFFTQRIETKHRC